MRNHARLFLLCGLAVLAACTAKDWRAEAIANAEDAMRTQVSDPAAAFTHVQITGDSSSGQTCGFVTAKVGTLKKGARFIVYIDGTAGPFVEAGMGRQPMSKDDFDWAWQNDCLKEGYKS